MIKYPMLKFGLPWCVAMAAAIYAVKGPSQPDDVPTLRTSVGEIVAVDANPFRDRVPETPMARGALFGGLPSGWQQVFRQMQSHGLVTDDDPWRIIGDDRNGLHHQRTPWDIAPEDSSAGTIDDPTQSGDRPL